MTQPDLHEENGIGARLQDPLAGYIPITVASLDAVAVGEPVAVTIVIHTLAAAPVGVNFTSNHPNKLSLPAEGAVEVPTNSDYVTVLIPTVAVRDGVTITVSLPYDGGTNVRTSAPFDIF